MTDDLTDDDLTSRPERGDLCPYHDDHLTGEWADYAPCTGPPERLAGYPHEAIARSIRRRGLPVPAGDWDDEGVGS